MSVLVLLRNSRPTSVPLIAMRLTPARRTAGNPAATFERTRPRAEGRSRIAQEDARALVDAGFMPLDHYLELASRYGWRRSAELESEHQGPLLRAG